MVALVVLVQFAFGSPLAGDDTEANELWAAARQGNAQEVRRLLEAGVPVNAATRYGVTALAFAAAKGHGDVVELLIAAKADVNTKDTFYGMTPLSQATSGKHLEIVRRLLEGGARPDDSDFGALVSLKDADLVRRALDSGRISDAAKRQALDRARQLDAAGVLALLEAEGDLAPLPDPIELEPAALEPLAGQYATRDGMQAELFVNEGQLTIRLPAAGDYAYPLVSYERHKFRMSTAAHVTLEFDPAADPPDRFTWASTLVFVRAAPGDAPSVPETSAEMIAQYALEDERDSSRNWPQFRGSAARGVADGQRPPLKWDAEKARNVKWKVPVPGLGHSAPVVWDDRIFLTTAVGQGADNDLRIGLYGDVDSVADASSYRFQVLCLDKHTGETIWLRTANRSTPAIKRHLKSTHANPTPATDGRHVVAFFGTEGLYCYSLDGELLWQKDVGKLDSGWFYDPDYQWGFGSSPVIADGLVYLQCDAHNNSFLLALDVATGSEVWRVPREEVPTWSTPTVCHTPAGPQLVTNGTRYVRGYDAETGRLLWQLGGNSEIAVPTPFTARGLIFAASGYRSPKPIHAIRLNAAGDLTPAPEGGESPGGIAERGLAWSLDRAGSYLPTPIVYREYLYVCNNNGIVTCHHAPTGTMVHRTRLGGAGTSFTASPVAGDGHVYFTAESGHVYVVKAGPELEQRFVNPLGEYCLSTPAVSDGLLLFRCHEHLIAVEQQLSVEELEALESSADAAPPEDNAVNPRR